MQRTSNHGERFPAFDKLRAASMLIVVVWHCASFYAEWPWTVKDNNHHFGFTVALWLPTGCTLRVFFVMAGFFTGMMVQRYGWAGMLRHRAFRLGVPFAIAVPVFSNSVAWQVGREVIYTPGHLWFIEVLAVITLIFAAVTATAQKFAGTFLARLDRASGWLIARPNLLPLLAIPTTALLYFTTSPRSPDPAIVTLPDRSFGLTIPVLLYYSVFYVLGWLLHSHSDLIPRFSQYSSRMLGIALAIKLASAVVLLATLREPTAWSGFVLRSAGALFTWLTVPAVIGLFQKHFNKDTNVGRYISDSAYWCYLIHLTFARTLQMLMVHWEIPIFFKFLFVAVGTLAICLVTYEYCVRYTIIGFVLNGPRTRPKGARSLAWRDLNRVAAGENT